MIDWLRDLAEEDRLLAIIAFVSAVLLGIAFLFALLTIGLRLRSMRRQYVRSSLEQTWEPLVLSVLAGDMTPADLEGDVPRRHALFFVAYLLRFIDRFAGEERHSLRALARPYLPLVAAQLRHRRAETRARGVQTLVMLGLDEYDREVVAALDDPSLTVAMVAARSLANREHTRFAPEILERIHRFRYWSPIYLSSLFTGMGSAVVPALRAIYADERANPAVRRVAADALHDLDDIGAVETAARIAATPVEPELHAASIRLLGRVGAPQHAHLARRALESGNPLLRLRAAETLGVIGGVEDLLRLRAAVDDSSAWVALAAARALARAGGQELLASLRHEEGPRGSLAREVLGEGKVA
jgi:hypothetical protein